MSENDGTLQIILDRLEKTEARLWSEIKALTMSVAELSAALKHPDPAHCTKVGDVERIDKKLESHEVRIHAIENGYEQVKGGSKVASWVWSAILAVVALIVSVWSVVKGGH